MSFQRIVLTIAAILLIVVLAVFAVLLYNKAAVKFPPEISNCPDYFVMKKKTEDGGVGEMVCYNDKTLGDSSCGRWYDTSKVPQTKAGKKEKCLKAKRCRWTWEGITDQGYC